MTIFQKRLAAIEKLSLPVNKEYPANIEECTDEELLEIIGFPDWPTDEQLLEIAMG